MTPVGELFQTSIWWLADSPAKTTRLLALSRKLGWNRRQEGLWWSIYRFLRIQLAKSSNNARWCMFENVDRLLKSPAKQRGRDFAIILSCLASLGYSVEWRVVNSAEYGFPQRRKRVYILAERNVKWDLKERLLHGAMASAFPMEAPETVSYVDIPADPYVASQSFNLGGKISPFSDAGVMVGNRAITCRVLEAYNGPRKTLGDVLVPKAEVPEEFFVPESQREKWEYLKVPRRRSAPTKPLASNTAIPKVPCPSRIQRTSLLEQFLPARAVEERLDSSMLCNARTGGSAD